MQLVPIDPPERLLTGPGPSNPDPRVLQAMAKRAFHHTAPVSSIYAFHEALRLIHEEGLEARWDRHRRAHVTLTNGLAELGLSLFTPEVHRPPMLNVIVIPEGVEDAPVRKALLERGIEVAPGFGPLNGKTWRVGLMGTNATDERVGRLLEGMREVLGR